VEHFEAQRSEAKELSIVQFAVERYDRGRSVDPEPTCLPRKRLIEGQVGGMKQPGSPGELAQSSEISDVVDVRVRMEQQLRLPAVTVEKRYDAVHAVAAIHDDGFAAPFVCYDGAIAGQRADRKRFDKHR
jgi:hypothetical protein